MDAFFRFVRDVRRFIKNEKIDVGIDTITLSRFESHFYRHFGMQFAYGQREVLLNAMNETFDKAFRVILQHGAYLPNVKVEYGEAWPPKKGPISRYRFVCYSEYDEVNVRSYGVKDVLAIGAPWLYLNSVKTITKKDSVGFFPAHHNLSYNYPFTSVEEIGERVSLVKTCFKGLRVTVFLYFSEFLRREWHDASKLFDFDVFCPGIPSGNPVFTPHPSRILFLQNLKRKLGEMEVCAFESYTTGILLAGSMGKGVALVRTPMTEFRLKEVSSEESFLSAVFKLAKDGRFVQENVIKDFSLRSLGQDQVKSEEELRAILEPVKLPSLQKIYIGSESSSSQPD